MNGELAEREREILDMWPRYEDGEYLWFGDAYVDTDGDANEVQAVELSEACADLVGLEGFHTGFKPGERVKRPAPEVLDADGVEIKVGDTAWDDDGVEMTVMSLVGELPGHVTTHSKIRQSRTASTRSASLTPTPTAGSGWRRTRRRTPFDYCKDVGHRLDTCENSEAYKARDIVRRAKKLAGVER